MNQENGQSRRLVVGLIIGAIFGLGVGLLIGLAFGYGIAPLEWTDGAPQDLRADYAAYYWELVSQSYAEHGNLELAKRQLGEWDDADRLQAALDRARLESSDDLKMVLDSLESKVTGAEAAPQVTPSETQPAEFPAERGGINWMTFFGVLLLILLILLVIALLVARARKRRELARGAEGVAEEPSWLATMREEEGIAALPAMGHFVTSYALGNDHYDESFSIETSTGEFLGECGVGISETIGEGPPDKVTAFEVWLFDKNDIRTVTKVLMSEYAYNDEELRDRLAPKGEAVLARANEPIVLETATLRVEATATEAIYGTDELPPKSFFERLTVELVAHQAEATSSAASVEEDEFDL